MPRIKIIKDEPASCKFKDLKRGETFSLKPTKEDVNIKVQPCRTVEDNPEDFYPFNSLELTTVMPIQVGNDTTVYPITLHVKIG